MNNRIKISDFVKLTGTTLKTIKYYHRIGLLPEPERSSGGYRLYGSEELNRMQVIKHLKILGLNLKGIKEILGDKPDDKTLREVLQSLKAELLREKKVLEERVAKIDSLLNEETLTLDEDIGKSNSFQMITEILGSEQMENYAQACPELFDQQKKIFRILDDFQWGENYQETFRALAEYFKDHPEQYHISLDFGVRLAKLSQLPEDSPEVEALARESADFIKSIPPLRKLLCNQPGIKKSLESLHTDMVAQVISPARIKHMKLLQKYLNS